jgi:lysophospholipase L1-like esterase
LYEAWRWVNWDNSRRDVPDAISRPTAIADKQSCLYRGWINLIAGKWVAEGDSLTQSGASYADQYAAARPGFTTQKVATGGQGTNNAIADVQADVYDRAPEVVGVWFQANDLAGGTYPTGADFANFLMSEYIDKLRARGHKVFSFTSTPQAAPAGNPTIVNPKRASYDAAMRSFYAEGRLDGLVDVAADPILGPDAAALDTALYSDGLHPTTAGQNRIGALAIPVIDRLLGYPSDDVPSSHTIPPQTGAALSTLTVSGAISPPGMDTPAVITVSGGDAEIEVTAGYWSNQPQMLPIGGSYRVRRTSSASNSTTVTSTVTVGGVPADYDVTTTSGATIDPPVFVGGATVLYHNGGFAGTVKTWSAVPFDAGHALFYTETDGGGRDVVSMTVNGEPCTRIINHAVGKDLFICNTNLPAGNYDVVLTMSAGIGQVWVPYGSIDSIDSPTPIGTAELSLVFRSGGNQTSATSITQTSTSLGIMIGRRGTSTGTLAINSVGPNGQVELDYGPGSPTPLNFFWGSFQDSGQPYFNKTGDANSFFLAAAWEGAAGAAPPVDLVIPDFEVASPTYGPVNFAQIQAFSISTFTTGSPDIPAVGFVNGSIFTILNFSTASPDNVNPVLGGKHVLTIQAYSTASPTTGPVTFGQKHNLSIAAFTTGSPNLGPPLVVQRHGLNVPAFTTASPSYGPVTLGSEGTANLTINAVELGSPTYGPPVWQQRHVLSINGFTTGSPTTGGVLWSQRHSLSISSFSVGQPDLGTVSLADVVLGGTLSHKNVLSDEPEERVLEDYEDRDLSDELEIRILHHEEVVPT